MRRNEEIKNPNSCLNRAEPKEMVFVLRGHDIAAPATIRFWCAERIRQGKYDSSIPEALECAEVMEKEWALPKRISEHAIGTEKAHRDKPREFFHD